METALSTEVPQLPVLAPGFGRRRGFVDSKQVATCRRDHWAGSPSKQFWAQPQADQTQETALRCCRVAAERQDLRRTHSSIEARL